MRQRIIQTDDIRRKITPCGKFIRDETGSGSMKYWKSSLTISTTPVGAWGWVSALDLEGQTIWIVDSHRDDGKRFVVRAEEILTAFLELERAIHEFAVSLIV